MSDAAQQWASVEILPSNGNVRLPGMNQSYGAVPALSLVERTGRAINLDSLRGKVWIADFIYTSCTDTCPLQSAVMVTLQKKWAREKSPALVSFSVDPVRDTPRALSRYARRFKADANRWLFLTGDKREMARLVDDVFHLRAESAPTTGERSSVILHSPSLMLVYRQMQIRGYYDGRYPAALQRLEKDVAKLLNENLQPAK